MAEGIARLPKGCKPVAGASKDTSRPALCGGEIIKEGEEWALYVTDSYKLARIPLSVEEGEPLTEGPISNEALKEIAKTGAFRANAVIEPLTDYGVPTGITLARPAREGNHPNYRQIIPDENASGVTLTLDAKLLKELSDAMGVGKYDQLTLHLDPEKFDAGPYLRAIRATVGVDRVGVIMPIRPK